MAAGDITYSNPGAGKDYASGIALADADKALNIEVGFVPTKITIHYKDTAATTVDRVFEWFKGMTAGYYWSTLQSTGAITEATSGGPIVYGDTQDDVYGSSESGSFQGFTIPAGLQDADSDIMYWEAWR